MEPSTYKHRILVAVTGLSPQIVTETLYALTARRHDAFVPTEIHLITTREGRERAIEHLLERDNGWFHRLRRDYALPPIAFSANHVHVVRDATGRPLDDIRNPADNAMAADAITERLRLLTREPDSALHVSIAGGRKTMSFYLGYALSLFGRAQDRLSHVLVNAPYESHPDFFYPTPYNAWIPTPEPDARPLDLRDAEVTLAEVPFVRLRDGLDPSLLEGSASFSGVVAEAQKAIPPVALTLRVAERGLSAAGTELTLRPAEFALYWLMAERAMQSRPGVHWSEPGLAEELLICYGRLVGLHSGEYERAERAYAAGVTKDNFDPAKSHINRVLRRKLVRHADPYLVKALDPIAKSRYRRFGLALPAEAIRVKSSRPNGDPNSGTNP